MRIGFVTCVRLGLACIEEIHRLGGQLEVLVTLRDEIAPRKSGRVRLNTAAQHMGAPLIKVRNINDAEALDALARADLDWLFIVGWSQIAKRPLLELPRRGVLGMHPTLLPQGRGRASIPWAIIKNLDRTGVTMFKLDEGTDTGPIVAQEVVPIAPRETATTLYDKVVAAHLRLVGRIWDDITHDRVRPTPQDESAASTWEARRPGDGCIDPTTMTGAQVDRLVRATTRPYPGAFVDLPYGLRLRIWAGAPAHDAATAAGPALTVADGRYVMTRFEVEHQQ